MKSNNESLTQREVDRIIQDGTRRKLKPLVIEGNRYYVFFPSGDVEAIAAELGKEVTDTPLGKGILWPLSE